MSGDRECPHCGQGTDGIRLPKQAVLDIDPRDMELDRAQRCAQADMGEEVAMQLARAQAYALLSIGRTLRRIESHMLRRDADPYEEANREARAAKVALKNNGEPTPVVPGKYDPTTRFRPG